MSNNFNQQKQKGRPTRRTTAKQNNQKKQNKTKK